ncbi:50S ribosomal protein L33 [Chloroflexota bacterium]
MAKKGEARVIISLACSECRERTYTTTKNRRNDSQRLELKKYCPRCRTHRLHKEVK